MESNKVVYGNFKSNKFDGMLVDANNVSGVEQNGTKIYLNCRFSNRLLISDYSDETEAMEDAQYYMGLLNNPMAAVFLITNDGMLQAYDAQSAEYRELRMSINIFKDED